MFARSFPSVLIVAGSFTVVAIGPTPAASRQAEPPPGHPLVGNGWQPRTIIEAVCQTLPWPTRREAMSDNLLSEECVIAEQGDLPGPADPDLFWTLSRRVLVYGPTPETQPSDSEFFPDTIIEDELVLFGVREDQVKPIWHDRANRGYEILRAPRTLRLGSDWLVIHRRCLNGTGGCLDHPYRLREDSVITPLVTRYIQQILGRLPAEWTISKGVWLNPARAAAEAPVYLPEDGNCCSTFEAVAFLTLSGDTLEADSIAILPVREGSTWLVQPTERFGLVNLQTTESDLVRRAGASAVQQSEVYLAEGFCTAGTRLFPNSTAELEIGWSDTTRTRPAFVRTRKVRGPWHTAKGVHVGTTLTELERLAGAPLSFSGFGWDYGGGTTWEEDGDLGLHLSIDPASNEFLSDLSSRDPRANEVFGDRQVRSDHPIIRQLRIVVEEMGVTWASLSDEHECR